MKKLFSILICIGLVLMQGCSENEDELKYVDGNVIVGFHREVTLRQAHDFVTQYGDSIGHVFGFFYYSNLPIDSLKFVVNFLTAKGFDASVQISGANNKIHVINNYYNDEDKSTIGAWIDLVENPILKFEDAQNLKSMLVFVQPGTEAQWIETHVSSPLVRYAELDYYFP